MEEALARIERESDNDSNHGGIDIGEESDIDHEIMYLGEELRLVAKLCCRFRLSNRHYIYRFVF